MAAYTAYTQALRKEGVLRRLEPAAADRGRDDRARRRRQIAGARRPVRRYEGAARRLLPRRRARSRRGARVGRALSRREPRHGRSAAGLADDVRRQTRAHDAGDGDERARRPRKRSRAASYGKLVAFLAARTRDVAAAEDALSDAFAAALAEWPVKGAPSNPEAWLMTVARRRLIDGARHRARARGRVGRSAPARRKPRRGGRRRRDSRSAPRAAVRLRASGDRRRRSARR